MTRVAVGSTNPAKTEAVRRAFDELAPGALVLVPVAADGGSDQPWGEATTRDGAVARARRALERASADWAIGLEGGLVADDADLLVTSWIAAVRADGALGLARTAGFHLPAAIAERVRAGEALAAAWRTVHGIEHIGRGGGTVGRLTRGRVDRARLYAEAVVLAVSLADGAA